MKIVLINAPWINNKVEYGIKSGARWAMVRKKDRTMPFYAFPFYLSYAASYLQSHGFSAYLRDSIAIEETKEEALHFIKESQADFVLIETSTPSIFHDFDFCDSIKNMNPEVKVALCGPHVTALPKEALEKSRADFVLIGEYEASLLNLTGHIRDKKDPTTLKGIACRKDDEIIVNERMDLIENLDTLPFPFRDKSI
ncbi:MAG: cobalamin-dependent protein, partial [Candidatus Aureabacteria bacterium]|nr:cobalamin-dependent protein [Candidatus Auribacterota bacterium]